MQFVAERILPVYVAALEEALDDALEQLADEKVRLSLLRLRRRLGTDGGRFRFEALHRLALMGEAQGWLDTEAAIVLQKLAYRVGLFQRMGNKAGE